MAGNKLRIVIVGGVAGGASCAARARRLSEQAVITVFERGPYVSFANCGLPYYVGQVIPRRDDLLLADPALFRERFNIDARVDSTVTAIDRRARTVAVVESPSGRRYTEGYDRLVIATGAEPVRPAIPGIDLPAIHSVWTVPEAERILERLSAGSPKRAVVVGGGFIGLEMVENLMHRGVAVTLVERLPQVMPLLDGELAEAVHLHLRSRRVDLRLATAVTGFAAGAGQSAEVRLDSGESIAADLVLLAVGVRPRVHLAREAGLAIGPRGGIVVDERMRTSDPDIWAVGDAVEVRHVVTGEPSLVPLAGPANRQGRIAADAILGLEPPAHTFRGAQGTAVCGVLGLTIAATGIGERQLRAAGRSDWERVYLHPDQHAGYYPGTQNMTLKLLFTRPEGRILGAQAVGGEGVDKRIDVIAMAIQMGGSVFDLEEAELCYAPQYGSAKDPVNLAGMIAANVLRGLQPLAHWDGLPAEGCRLIDVRDADEYARGHVPGALHLPLNQLRSRLGELPRDQPLRTYCFVGQRSYYATRILLQEGFSVCNLAGGYSLYRLVRRQLKRGKGAAA
jgi:NADPH-dependent 2,4-dienoyl-CoA reductase/sulfur reductase-like enzyme/rhodanese-related sulfurtransferase